MWGVEAAAAVGCCGGSLFGWLRRRGRPPVGVCCCWGGFSVARVSVLLCAVLCWRWGASCELEAACWGGAGRSAAECWMGSHGEFPRCCSLLVARCPFLLWGSAQGGGVASILVGCLPPGFGFGALCAGFALAGFHSLFAKTGHCFANRVLVLQPGGSIPRRCVQKAVCPPVRGALLPLRIG